MPEQLSPLEAPKWALDRFLQLTPAADGWTADVPPSWAPTGAAHGGVLFAIAITAMRRVSPHPDVLTATAHFLRPTAPGPAQVTAELVRGGGAHATVQATIVQDGKETLRVLAVFGVLPDDPPRSELVPPTLPPPEECAPALGSELQAGADATDYGSSLDVRVDPTVGWLNGRRAGNAEITGWCRTSDERPHDDASLALFADAFPPPVFDVLPAFYVPTLELTLHVRGRATTPWLLGRFTTRAINEPYHEEDGLLWDGAGNLVAMSRQFALTRT
ncbi:thioesterase family protein [Saccharopolyspora sp. HNM0983]|uniref:Thioesterase family protein n=1 Tax=Saccharopolyspora montiporae TaxID=2781240 RepID=A0A929BEF3_9PSEU|nr:thioesterase family protein [Saccharopolyspora sp. HNM0983]